MRALAHAIRDVFDGLKYHRFWLNLALLDWGQRYHRSAIGILWIFGSFALFVGVKALIFGSLTTAPPDYFSLYVALGFLAWVFISAVVNEGCMVFVQSATWIRGISLPLSTYVYQSVLRNLIAFAVSGIFVICALIYYRWSIKPIALLAIPALGVYIINALWVQFLFGTISARFRDFAYLMQTAMRLLIFLTPIMWIPSQLGSIGPFIYWNPLTHFVEIFRAPILDGQPALGSWMVVLAVTVIGWIAAMLVFARFRHRIVFWL
ncbi:MAG: ABC transporter permease [Hyphomicrobiaceae bacterium]|nr:ABC transporter permease [Hyphomicrobiaceae bacterium]